MKHLHTYIIATVVCLLPVLVNSQPVLGVNNANINVAGNMSMKGGFQAIGNSTVVLNGNITLYDNIGLGGAGSWIDNTTTGVITNNSIGSVIMNGNLSSIISGNSLFPILHINAIGGVSLSNDVLVTNLTLTQGRLITGAYRLVVNNYADSAVIAGIGNTNFTNGWVYGNLRRYYNDANTNYHFPVGNVARGNLIKLINNNSNPLVGINYIDASFGAKRGNDNNLSLIVGTRLYDSINTGGVWYVTPNTQPTSGNYTLQAYFNGFTGLKNKKFDLLRREDSSSIATDWQVPTNSSLDAADTRLVSNGYAKRTNISSFSQFAIAQASALSLMVKAEYFFDTDPGFGNALDIPLTYGLDISNKNFSANTSNLPVGIHKLYIRTQDGDGLWSNTTTTTFYKQALAVTADITKAEYFFDTDPGFSNGTNIPIAQGLDIAELNFSANVGGLSAGIHRMYLRTKDAAGIWSIVNTHLFYKSADLPNITKAAYYFDNNSNSPIDIAITPATDIVDINFAANISGLSTGIHRMYLRTKDAAGVWSIANLHLFYKSAALSNITKAAYYFDNNSNSPIDIVITPATDIADINFAANISSLPVGIHRMYLRTKDADGNWSIAHQYLFNKSGNSVSPSITKAEYYIDTDPGFGNGIDFSVTAAADVIDLNVAVNTSALANGTHTLFIRSKDADGGWSITNKIPFAVLKNSWTGIVSTDWFDAGNWTDGVPTTTSNAIIVATAPRMPITNNSSPVTQSLDIETNAYVQLNGSTLTINGNIGGNGVLKTNNTANLVLATTNAVGNIGTLRFDAANNNLQNLTVGIGGVQSPTVQLGTPLHLYGVATISNGILAANGFLNLKSNALGTARVAAVTGNIIGNVVVERFIPAKRAYRFLTPAVTTIGSIKNNWQEAGNTVTGLGTHITGSIAGANGFDATQSGNPSMYTLNTTSQLWENITNTNNNTLSVGKGYRLLVRGDRNIDLNNNNAIPNNTVIRSTGTLAIGTINLSSLLGSNIGNYSLIGNPYASPISWLGITKANVSNTYYAWDPTRNGTYGRGAYVAYNTITGVSDISSAVDDNIQSGQGFFVLNTATNPSLIINEANKTSNSLNTVFRTNNQFKQLSIQLFITSQLQNGTTADAAKVVFDNSFSNNKGAEDAVKITTTDENIAIDQNGMLLSIDGRKEVLTTDTVKIKLWNLLSSSYTMRLETQNLQPGVTEAFIKDSYLNTSNPVSLSGITDVVVQTNADSNSINPNRFYIVFKNLGTLPVTITTIKAYKQNTGVQVEWNVVDEINMAKYEVERSADARLFNKIGTVNATNTSMNKKYNLFDAIPEKGLNYYRIKSIGKDATVQYTAVVMVNMQEAEAGFTVYPNPVKGSLLNITLNNLSKGIYGLNLFDITGQKVLATKVKHETNSASYTIQLPLHLSKGHYKLELIGTDKTMIRNILIDQ